MKRTLLVALGIMMASLVLPAHAGVRVGIGVRIGPPPPRHEVIVVRPHRNVVWVEGHWLWNARQAGYVWISGRWINARPGFVWVDGRWKNTRHGWTYKEGYWRKGRG
jgi:hypothetical protein